MVYWFDITNTPQVHFLLSISRLITEIDTESKYLYTARDFAETIKLLDKKIGAGNYINVGHHYGKSYIKKVLGVLIQTYEVNKLNLNYDYCLSCGSERAVWNAKLKRKKAISFGDNNQARQWTHAPFCYFGFFPEAVPEEWLASQGYTKDKSYRYHGYKEDIYLGEYIPDSSFINSLPFSTYVVVRPENIMANYIRKNKVESIVPELLQQLTAKGVNILYLPRYESDRNYAQNIKNIYIPNEPINGLDACYFADAVLTGAGTFAREAACLGVPSFSFYSGVDLLSVDKQLISEGKMFFSRNVCEITDKLIKSKRGSADFSRCKAVRTEIGDKLKEILI